MKALTVPANTLVKVVSDKLKEVPEVTAPEWAGLVKTGSHAERVPSEPDFWFKRTAALLISVSREPAGVRAMQHKYGGRVHHMVSRAHHRKAGGKTIRLAFQQLEKAGFVKKDKGGRVITPKGVSFIDKAVAGVEKK